MHIIQDQYNGVIIEHSSLPDDITIFEAKLLEIIASLQNKRLLWITIESHKSNFIPLLISLGFNFHHCEETQITLIKKLTPNAFVPIHTNHAVGVGGLVIKDDCVLMIKDRINQRFKLPGGYVDSLENITAALEREIFEETGIKAFFDSIVGISHYANADTNTSNVYIVCKANSITSDINIQDYEEIIEAKWIALKDLFEDAEIHEYTKTAIKSALNNNGIKLLDEQFFTKQGLTMEHFFN